MKKMLSIMCAVMVSVCALQAQDVNQATDLYNAAATALNNGDKAGALSSFQSALKMAKACGETGQEIVANCENAIPKLMVSLAKDYIKSGNYDEAVAQLKATVTEAGALGATDVVSEATAMIPQVYMQKGNSSLKTKDVAGAIAAYKQVLEINPSNGKASLNLGQAYELAGKQDEAIKAYEAAAAAGQTKQANKKLSTIYLRRAQQANKAQKYADAVKFAMQSNSYVENANANYIAGLASQNAGNKADAIKYYETFLTLAPTDSKAEDVRKVVEGLKK